MTNLQISVTPSEENTKFTVSLVTYVTRFIYIDIYLDRSLVVMVVIDSTTLFYAATV